MLLLQHELNKNSSPHQVYQETNIKARQTQADTEALHKYNSKLNQLVTKYDEIDMSNKIRSYALLPQTEITAQECRQAIMELYDLVLTLKTDANVAIKSPPQVKI